MVKKFVVYTCITGGYDTLREVRYLCPSIDYICFTDNSKLTSKTWKIRPLPSEVLSESTAVKRQRLVKVLAHKFLSGYEASLWIDSNIEVIGDLIDFFNKYDLSKKFLYVNKHPSRDCLYREQLAVIRMNRDTFENTSPQINRYREEGFPEHYGLAETNILLRRHGDKRCVKLMEAWASEIRNGSHRDQLSFNYAIWKTDVKDSVEYLDEKYYNLHVSDNAFFCLRRHINIGKIDAFPNQTKAIGTKELAKKEEDAAKGISSKAAKNEDVVNTTAEKKDSARKPVSVVIFTHNRTNVARETLKSLFKNLKYSGELNWILADDRSTPEHLAAMKAVFDEAKVKYELCQTTSTRFGLGASMNIGLQLAFKKSDIALRVEDDWILEKELSLDEHVRTLDVCKNVAGIRMGMVGGGVNTDSLLFKNSAYKPLVGTNDQSWLFVNQVALVHRRIYDALGWYLENIGADKSEEEFRTRFNKATGNGRKKWLLLAPKEMKWRTFDDPSLWFIHVGRSTLGHTIYREPKRFSWIYEVAKKIEIKPIIKSDTGFSWPTISVMMTTHNRTAVACFCLESLIQKLRYSGRIHWIVCDDRSEPGHCEALESKFKHFGTSNYSILKTNNERWGLGASINNGLKEAFNYGDIVLTTEDDWYLKDVYDLDEKVKILIEDNNVAGIRIGALCNELGNNLKPDATHKDYYKLEAPKNKLGRFFIFNNQVMLRHKRIFDKIGFMKENCPPDEQEQTIVSLYNNLTDFGRLESFKTLWPKGYDIATLYGANNPFFHIGKSTIIGKHREIRKEFEGLNDLNLDKQLRRQNRTISIIITTHNRTKLAKETLKSLTKNLYYSGKFHWIICDDRSKPGHIEELKKTLLENNINDKDITLCKTNANHFSLGASLNNGLKEAWKYGNVVLTTEDDWILQKKLNMDVFENAILSNTNVAGIRFATLLRHRSDLENFSKNFSKITNKSGKKFIFNNQVMLRHKRIFDKLGYYKENTSDIQESEDIMSNAFNALTKNGLLNNFVVLWPKNFPVNVMNNINLPFIHAGVSTVGHKYPVDRHYKKLNQ